MFEHLLFIYCNDCFSFLSLHLKESSVISNIIFTLIYLEVEKQIFLFSIHLFSQFTMSSMTASPHDLLDILVLIIGFSDPAVVFQERRLLLAVLDYLAGPDAAGCKHETKKLSHT